MEAQKEIKQGLNSERKIRIKEGRGKENSSNTVR